MSILLQSFITILLFNKIGDEAFGFISSVIAICFLCISLFATPLQIIILRNIFEKKKIIKFRVIHYIYPFMMMGLTSFVITAILFTTEHLLNIYTFLLICMLTILFLYVYSAYFRGIGFIYQSQYIELGVKIFIPGIFLFISSEALKKSNETISSVFTQSTFLILLASIFSFWYLSRFFEKKKTELVAPYQLKTFVKLQISQFTQLGIAHADVIFVSIAFGFSEAAIYRFMTLIISLLSNNEATISIVINEKLRSVYLSGNLMKFLLKFRLMIATLLLLEIITYILLEDHIKKYIFSDNDKIYEMGITLFILQGFKDIFAFSKTSAMMVSLDNSIAFASWLRLLIHFVGLLSIYVLELDLIFVIFNFYLAAFSENLYIMRDLRK